MKNKESNIEIVKRARDKFKVGKVYLIQIISGAGVVTDKKTPNTLNRCIKKYRTYALFDALDNKGNRLYTTTIDYIDDSYRYREVKDFGVIDNSGKW